MPGTTWKRGKKDQGPRAKSRRAGALIRLEEQIRDNQKPGYQVKNAFVGFEETIPLNDYDQKRIKKEIETLRTRI